MFGGCRPGSLPSACCPFCKRAGVTAAFKGVNLVVTFQRLQQRDASAWGVSLRLALFSRETAM